MLSFFGSSDGAAAAEAAKTEWGEAQATWTKG